jgi:hypothetical protein
MNALELGMKYVAATITLFCYFVNAASFPLELRTSETAIQENECGAGLGQLWC